MVTAWVFDLQDTADWGKSHISKFKAGKTQPVSFNNSNNSSGICVKTKMLLGLSFFSYLDLNSYIVSNNKKIGVQICYMKFLCSKVVPYLESYHSNLHGILLFIPGLVLLITN